jgi:hypothetical protein
VIVVYATGQGREVSLRPIFDRQIKLEFQGARITSDGSLCRFRQM